MKWLLADPKHRDKSPAKPIVRLIVSTYHSASTVSEAFYSSNIFPAITIFDEAHVTCVSQRPSKRKRDQSEASSSGVDFALALKDWPERGVKIFEAGMTSERRLFMTATRRVPKGSKVKKGNDGEDMAEDMAEDMENKELYGDCVYRLPMERAIELGLIRDYVVYAVGYKPEPGSEATNKVKGVTEEKWAEMNFWNKLLALTDAMHNKEEVHKGFVFMSRIDAVNEAQGSLHF